MPLPPAPNPAKAAATEAGKQQFQAKRWPEPWADADPEAARAWDSGLRWCPFRKQIVLPPGRKTGKS